MQTGVNHSTWYIHAMESLLSYVQQLSHAKDLDAIMKIVRIAARDLTKADGATFVLLENNQCYYAEENAISPLWKGQRFPMNACVSGWVMKNGKTAIIEDIYQDERIPKEAYKPTFVKSLVMVPIRKHNPIGAIGNYWKDHHQATDKEINILEMLANFTSISIENVYLQLDLEKKIRALEASNRDLNRFAWIASHDLKSPLRAIANLSKWIEEDLGDTITETTKKHLKSR